jgi:Xaa-Pro dipeptidase
MLMNSCRLFERMKRDGLDAIIATTPENVTYSSGFWAMTQWIRRGPQNYVLTPAPERGKACLIASSDLLDLAADRIAELDTWVPAIRAYGFFAIERDGEAMLDPTSQRLEAMLQGPHDSDPIAALIHAIQHSELRGATVGIDEDGIAPRFMDRLADALPRTKFTPAADVFRFVRAVKTPVEVLRLRRAASISEEAINAALAIAVEGVTEIELACAFHTQTVRAGATPVLGCIGVGARSAFPNVQPSAQRLQPADVIRFDVGGRYQHYRADIARIATLGRPVPKVARYYHALRKGLDRAYELVRPGVRASDIFAEVVAVVRREGLPHYRRHHVGHGIGLDGYEPPILTERNADVLEAGMVLCIETPYYELGLAGLQIEDMVVVTKDGVETLMASDTDLRVI